MQTPLICCCLALLFAHSASAATFTVTNTQSEGPGSLHQAVVDMNAASGNVHVIEAQQGLSGTITVATPLPDVTKPLVRITGSGRDALTLDLARVQNFVVDTPPNALFVLEDITIANGIGVLGGCIETEESLLLQIRRVRFLSCETQNAGLTRGGALYASGQVQIEDSEFVDNVANGIGGTNARGGAIYHFNGELTIDRSSFIGNIAIADDMLNATQSGGGAVYSSASSVRLSDVLFDANSAEAGGAVFLSAVSGSSSIERSVFIRNAASFAGMAFYATANEDQNNPEVSIDNTLFTKNQKLDGSQAAVVGASRISLALRNNTFFDNRLGTGGFAFLYTLNPIPVPVISHNVIQTPLGGSICRTQGGLPVPDIASENIYVGGTCFADAPTDQTEVDLQFFDLSIPIADAKMVSVPVPLVTSPVVNSGAPTASNTDPTACLEEDIFGNARVGGCDAGVFEGGLELELFSDGFEAVPIR